MVARALGHPVPASGNRRRARAAYLLDLKPLLFLLKYIFILWEVGI